MKSRKLIISEGNRPLWQLIIASVHYTAIICLVFFFVTGWEFTTETKAIKRNFHLLQAIILLLPSALAFSMVKDLLFDLENKKYKIQHRVGPLKFGTWKKLPKIEYVSVFRQPKQDGEFVFEANLWYSKNKHFNVYESDTRPPAWEMGHYIAKALKVKLLDATDPHNFTWATPD